MYKEIRKLIAGNLLLIFTLLFSGCNPASTPIKMPTPESHALAVPYAEAPTINGTLARTEWDAAITKTFADGSELLLMRDANYLYLAIRAATDEMIAANIYTEESGGIFIHHASAALGTGIYQPNEKTWIRVQDFHWQCRATDNSAASEAERAAFLENVGWLAANSRLGTPNELEYQIKITHEALPLAVSFMRSSEPGTRIYFPIDLADDTTQPTPGGLPETRNFLPEAWLLLDLANHE